MTQIDDTPLKAPFPYFGGKSKIAPTIWERFGDVRNYVEPFFGSGAALLWRPRPFSGVETVNDKDGFVSNFWRAVQADPSGVAFHADWPVNENDLHARHVWLVGQKESLQTRLDGDHEFYDAKIAGWWCWGVCCWIGSGFCSGQGPWHSVADAAGVRQLVHLGNAGMGVNREGIARKRPLLPGRSLGNGVHSSTGRHAEGVYEWMRALSERLRLVRVCSGDWSRVCGPTVTIKQGLTAVFLDPPYADTAGRQADLYRVDCDQVAHDVRRWAIENGDNKELRICLAGYDGEHEMPDSWQVVEWKASGGYGSYGDDEESGGRANCKKERLWFSPHCLSDCRAKQASMF